MAGASSVSHSQNVGEPFIKSDANSNCNKLLSPTISDVLFGVLLCTADVGRVSFFGLTNLTSSDQYNKQYNHFHGIYMDLIQDRSSLLCCDSSVHFPFPVPKVDLKEIKYPTNNIAKFMQISTRGNN